MVPQKGIELRPRAPLFLKAMSGEGDKNKDGKVTDTELKNYLDETMTYYARRYYGRDQTVQIIQGH